MPEDVYEIRCSQPGCNAFEKLPPVLADKPDDWTAQWLMGRAWGTEANERYVCPEHW
jgi:hypothetical protein